MAHENVDVALTIKRGRRIPCICPRQHEKSPPIGEVVGFGVSRPIERVKCSDCGRRWKRVNA